MEANNNILVRPTCNKILIMLAETKLQQVNITDIARDTGISYAWCHKRVRELEVMKMVSITNIGRESIVRLTNHGRGVAQTAQAMQNMVNSI